MFEMVSVNVAFPTASIVVGPSIAISRSAPDVIPLSRRKTAELIVLS